MRFATHRPATRGSTGRVQHSRITTGSCTLGGGSLLTGGVPAQDRKGGRAGGENRTRKPVLAAYRELGTAALHYPTPPGIQGLAPLSWVVVIFFHFTFWSAWRCHFRSKRIPSPGWTIQRAASGGREDLHPGTRQGIAVPLCLCPTCTGSAGQTPSAFLVPAGPYDTGTRQYSYTACFNMTLRHLPTCLHVARLPASFLFSSLSSLFYSSPSQWTSGRHAARTPRLGSTAHGPCGAGH